MQSEMKHWLKFNLAARKAVLFVIEIKLIYALWHVSRQVKFFGLDIFTQFSLSFASCYHSTLYFYVSFISENTKMELKSFEKKRQKSYICILENDSLITAENMKCEILPAESTQVCDNDHFMTCIMSVSQ